MTELRLLDVRRDYKLGGRQVHALSGITISVKGGEFLSVVGPSGSGKSTLLHLMGGLDRPTSGLVRFDGTDLGSMSDDQLADFRRQKLGFVFQFFNLLPMLTAWENVAVPRLLDGERLGAARGDAVALLDRVGLGDRVSHRPAELSGGQMQRVALARALIMDPAVILADEPTGNLDSGTGAKILELLAGVARDGSYRAVVIVTHNPAAASWSDRVVRLEDGVIVAAGSPATMLPGARTSITEEAR